MGFKYEGCWGTTSTMMTGTMPSNNFRELRKYLREVCRGNLHQGERGWVEIWYKEKGPSYDPTKSLYYAGIK